MSNTAAAAARASLSRGPLYNLSPLPPTIDRICMPIDRYIRDSKVVGALQVEETLPHGGAANPNNAGTILVLQGPSSPDVIRKLRDESHVSQDVLDSHYDFRSSRLPCAGHLPSRPPRFATIRFTTIGSLVSTSTAAATGGGGGGGADDDILAQLAAQLDMHHKDCHRGNRFGRECFRAVNLHARHFFSVEQRATFSVKSRDDSTWSAVLLSDNGRRSGYPPWTFNHHKDFTNELFFSTSVPHITTFRDSMSHNREPESTATGGGSHNTRPGSGSSTSTSDNSNQLLMLDRPNPFRCRDIAMSSQDQDLCSQDPFVLVADLLETSALSWMQFLNFLRELHRDLPDEANVRASLLSRDRVLIDDCTRYALETIRFIDSRHNLEWPGVYSNSNNNSVVARVDAIAQRLRRDFVTLRDDAATLASTCKDSIDIAMSTITIRASEQAVAEGRRAHLFTYLAFLFVPVTLIASIFGMNVSELDDPPSITVFFSTAVPITMLFLLIPAWSRISQYLARLSNTLDYIRG